MSALKPTHPLKLDLGSEEFERARVGHLIASREAYDAWRLLGLGMGNVVPPGLQRAIEAVYDFHERHGRHPTLQELKFASKVIKEEPLVVQFTQRAIDSALAATEGIAPEVLWSELAAWKIALTIKSSYEDEIQAAYLRGDLEHTLRLMQTAVDECARLATINQTSNQAGTEFFDDRETARDQAQGRTIATGIVFLDDALGGGLGPGELTVVTSKTSVGKSQLLLRMAEHATDMGRKALLFALEAYPGESQDRLAWPIYRQLYHRDHPHAEPLDGQRWAHGDYQELLRPYRDRVRVELAKKDGLVTKFKITDRYGIDAIELDVRRAAKQGTDLILIDHLEFVDDDGPKGQKYANRTIYDAQGEIMARLKRLADTTRCHIVVAVHVKKAAEAKRFHPLIPDLDDMVGSRNISKVAPTVIALASTKGTDPTKLPTSVHCVGDDGRETHRSLLIEGSQPTLVAVTKLRGLDGGAYRTRYAALCHFSNRSGIYLPQYSLGQLSAGDTIWQPVYADDLPSWARKAARYRSAATANVATPNRFKRAS